MNTKIRAIRRGSVFKECPCNECKHNTEGECPSACDQYQTCAEYLLWLRNSWQTVRGKLLERRPGRIIATLRWSGR